MVIINTFMTAGFGLTQELPHSFRPAFREARAGHLDGMVTVPSLEHHTFLDTDPSIEFIVVFSPPWSFRFISRCVCIFTYIYITYTYYDCTCFNASVKSSSFLSLLRYVFHLSMVLVQDSW